MIQTITETRAVFVNNAENKTVCYIVEVVERNANE